MTDTFHRAGRGDAIAEGVAIGIVVAGWPVLLARADGRLHATIDRCSHAASELSTGRIRRGAVMCPLHGARFALATGKCIGGTYQPLLVFAAREDADGWVEIAVPDTPPGFEHLPVRPRN